MFALLGAIVPVIGKIIGEVVTDKDEANRLQAEITKQLLANSEALVKAQAEIISAEAKSEHWLAAVWRPITMLVFVSIIANNYVLAPYAAAFGFLIPTLDIPEGMWGLLQLGIGGYIASRGVEKVAERVGGKSPVEEVKGAFRSLRGR